MENFKKLGISDHCLYYLKRKGFKKPTKIQEITIPVLMKDNKDILAQAQTGTGKTAAFGLPLIEKVKNSGNIEALIIAPTRELVLQVCDEINSFSFKKDISIIPIYGGQSIDIQLKKLKKGASIVVGTPGRILDHLKRKTLDIGRIKYFILDEADEMLNMGFIEDIKEIFTYTPKDKRVLLFSATMPKKIKNLAIRYMKDPEFLKAENQITTDLTEQIYYEVDQFQKFDALCRLLDMNENFYGLVFCQTKIEVDKIANKLAISGYNAEALHGNLSQAQREKTLDLFRKKRVKILVATDVAARGIDINNLTHVINFSVPQNPEIYIHRIGRTGRAGKKGVAVTFVTQQEIGKMEIIKRKVNVEIKKKKFPGMKEIFHNRKNKINKEIKKYFNISNDFFKSWAEELIESNDDPVNVVKALLMKNFNNIFDEKKYSDLKKSSGNTKKKVRLFFSKGKNDGISRSKLINFISSKANISKKLIEKVDVFDNFSFITVPKIEAEIIIYTFKNIKNKKKPLVERAKSKIY